jgi:hypothetical protein
MTAKLMWTLSEPVATDGNWGDQDLSEPDRLKQFSLVATP